MIARAVAISLAGSAAIVVAVSAQQPVFRAEAEIVSIPVAVTRGRVPVADLGDADFVLEDNGVRQSISVSGGDAVPLDVTLVMCGDQILFADRLIAAGLQALRVAALVRPPDRVRVVDVGGWVRGRLLGPDDHLGLHTLQPTPGISLYDGLFYALAFPVEPGRRHLAIAFTSGYESTSVLDAETFRALVRRSDAVLHAVLYTTPQPVSLNRVGITMSSSGTRAPADDPSGVDQPPRGWFSSYVSYARWQESYGELDRAVQATGGQLHVVKDDAAEFEKILSEFRTSYVLRYRPTNVPGKGWHDVRVSVNRSGLTVRAKKGYER
jgi:hypothetical protein